MLIAAKAQWAFVAGTVVQMAVMLWAPHVYADLSPAFATPHHVFFRLIGCAEVGLMLLYVRATQENDWVMTAATVCLRLCVVPFLLTMVLRFDQNWDLLLGVIQDVVGASATLYYLAKQAGAFPARNYVRGAHGEALFAEHGVRLALLFAGYIDIRESVNMFHDPFGYAAVPVVADEALSAAPHHLGYRAFAFQGALLGLYQVVAAVSRAPMSVYQACGLWHVSFAVLVSQLSVIVDDPVLAPPAVNAPDYHAKCGAAITIACALLTLQQTTASSSPSSSPSSPKQKAS